MRSFGVEEELLLVDATTSRPVALGESVVHSHQAAHRSGPVRDAATATASAEERSGHALATELHLEQLEVVGPPQTNLVDQLEAIRGGRALAGAAAAEFGGRVVALASPVSPGLPHLATDLRYRRIGQRFERLVADQLTCGFHVHVEVASREEGVQVLDRLQPWLPVLLAMSANSPFWYGRHSGFSSYRYVAWSRWPTAGPTGVFGSVEEYDRRASALVNSGTALDAGMLYYDARLSCHFPTVEVRITDVCLDARHAAVIAAVVRALVETSARQWRAGMGARPLVSNEVRAAAWVAAQAGLEGSLVDPVGSSPRAAGEVVASLMKLVRPVLAEYREKELVDAVVAQMLQGGTGCRVQQSAFAARRDMRDVVDVALQLTHQREDRDTSAALWRQGVGA